MQPIQNQRWKECCCQWYHVVLSYGRALWQVRIFQFHLFWRTYHHGASVESAARSLICWTEYAVKVTPKIMKKREKVQLCLNQQTLEVALINNCDWLNMTWIFTNAKYRNTAYWQYILWFYGRLGYGKRKLPSAVCIWNQITTTQDILRDYDYFFLSWLNVYNNQF